jgi:hypothetical protein
MDKDFSALFAKIHYSTMKCDGGIKIPVPQMLRKKATGKFYKA